MPSLTRSGLNPPWVVLNKPQRRSSAFPRKREPSRERLDPKDDHQSLQTASNEYNSKRHYSIQRNNRPHGQIVEGHFLVATYQDTYSSFGVSVVKDRSDESSVDGCLYPAFFYKNT